MGAYEFVPAAPSVAASATSPLAPTTATVNGTIDPRSARTYYHLEYGPTAAHGSSTPVRVLPAAAGPSTVKFALSGLAVASTVHFSIVATSDGGTTTTPNASFSTPLPLRPPAVTPVAPPANPPRTAGTVKLSCRRITRAGKRRVRCTTTQSNLAEGRARLTLKRVRSTLRATGRARVRPDGRAVIVLKLTRKGRYRATIVLPTPAGTTETIRRRLTIR